MKIKRNTLVLLPKKKKYLPEIYRLALVKGKVPQKDGHFRVRCIDRSDDFVENPLPLLQVDKRIKEASEAIERYREGLLGVLIKKLCESLGYGEEEE